MRPKLKSFREFADQLLPHETQYLLSVQQFEDPEKLALLRCLDHNCHHLDAPRPFDPELDRRKYSYLKAWVEKQLQAVDVDAHFAWMCNLEQKIHTDAIQPDEEKALLKALRNSRQPLFNFTKFFELLRMHRQFLQVRLRHALYQEVDDFLRVHRAAYERSMRVTEQFDYATRDIVNQFSTRSTESIQWQRWLTEVFFDEELDGSNRYMALVRLVYIAFNYKRYQPILPLFDYLDQNLAQGRYYSRRILLNYYNNRLLLHTGLGEVSTGINYGYLAIRAQNHDYLLYVNNLCKMLLQQGQVEECWRILREARPALKQSPNFHSRVGFSALYIRTLVMMGAYEKACAYAEINLRAYEKEILRHRWHAFFSAYVESLLLLQRYARMTELGRRYKLLERERSYVSETQGKPIITWYLGLARYHRGEADLGELRQQFRVANAGGIEQTFHPGAQGINLLVYRVFRDFFEELRQLQSVPQPKP
jgi:hypothetical protein